MKVLAKQNRQLLIINAQNTQNENDAEKIILQVPEKYEDFYKKIVFVTPDGVVWDLIENNEYLIKRNITKYEQVQFYIWLTKNDVDFRTEEKTLKFNINHKVTGEVTPEEQSDIERVIAILESEITKVENLDIDANKVENTTTITITDKNGNEKTVNILDGEQGYTPQKGIDYYTEEEKQELIQEIEGEIYIPSKTSDLDNDSGFINNSVNNLINYELKSNTGSSILLSINPTTYVMTLQLKNSNNTVISSGSIDLPLETMVVNARYDDNTKKIILTLQSGTEVGFSVADLVSGLVDETTFNTAINTINNQLINKVEKVTGKGLSTEDYTTEEKTKLSELNNYDDTELRNKVQSLQQELSQTQEDLDNSTLTISGTGENVTLNNTAKGSFKTLPYPQGNSKQNGTPTPSSPVAIKSAGDSENISEIICNKNIYNDTLESGTINSSTGVNSSSTTSIRNVNYVDVAENTSYTITVDVQCRIALRFYDINNGFLSSGTTSTTGYSNTFTTPSNCRKFRFILVDNTNTKTLVQVEKSSSTSYVAHEQQTKTIPVQAPFRSVGNTRDCFIKKNGIWNERHYITRKILNGTEEWTAGATGGFSRFYTPFSNASTTTNRQIISSNYFHYLSSGNEIGGCFISRYSPSKSLFLYPSADITTVDGLKSWLSELNTNGNPVYIDYILQTPVDIPCTSSQIAILDEIEKLHSYQGTTNIFSTDETSPYFEVGARGDLNAIIENLESRIALVEG